MPTESLEVSHLLPVRPERIFKAWLDAGEHAKFTGGDATVDPAVGGKFTAWDGYIVGRTLLVEPHRRIVQSWRSTDFPAEAADSKLEILLDAVPEGTKVTLRHTNIPEGQATSYESGWVEHYFEPMSRYFTSAGSRLHGAQEALTDAAEHAREAIEHAGEQAQAALGAAGNRALKAAKKTAKKAAGQVKELARKATKRLAKAKPKKARAAKKVAKKAAKKTARKPAKKAGKGRRGARR